MKKGITNALRYPKSCTMWEGWKGNEPNQFAAPVFSAASNDKSPTVPKTENLKTPHLRKQIKKKLKINKQKVLWISKHPDTMKTHHLWTLMTGLTLERVRVLCLSFTHFKKRKINITIKKQLFQCPSGHFFSHIAQLDQKLGKQVFLSALVVVSQLGSASGHNNSCAAAQDQSKQLGSRPLPSVTGPGNIRLKWPRNHGLQRSCLRTSS